MPLIFFIAYAVIGIIAGYFVGGYAAWNSAGANQDQLDGDDIGFGLFCAGLSVIAWPIAIPWTIVYWTMDKQKQPMILWTPPDRKQQVRERDLRAREEAVREIERTHGIGDD